MRVFTSVDFVTPGPVGAGAIVVAPNEVRARELLRLVFEGRGLQYDGTLVEVDVDEECVSIMCEGDY